MQAQTTSLENHGYKSQQVLKESLIDGVYSRVEVVVRKERPSECFVAKSFDSSSSSQATELLSELWFLENLRHPSLVWCIETWDSTSSSWGKAIIMEFAEHGDMRKAMKSMKKSGQHLHGEVIRLWLRQMLEGLAYIHSRHVVHRDLKTANVFLANQWRRSLIGDFGLALVLETPTVCANDCVGTPYYMAPEVLQKQPYAAAVDVWAVGAIFYELMAFQRPFECKRGVHGERERFLTLAFQIVNEDPNVEALLRAGYSDTLIHFVMQTLSKDPTKRPDPAQLLKDVILWSDFDMVDSEWLAVDAFAISERARGVNRERIPKESRRGIAQLPEVSVGAPWEVVSRCSSPSIASGPSSTSTASGPSSPSTASGPSSPSNAAGCSNSSGTSMSSSPSTAWASNFMDRVKMLKVRIWWLMCHSVNLAINTKLA